MIWLLVLIPSFAASIALEHRKLRRPLWTWTVSPVEIYCVSDRFSVLLQSLVAPSNIAPRPYFVKSPTP